MADVTLRPEDLPLKRRYLLHVETEETVDRILHKSPTAYVGEPSPPPRPRPSPEQR